MSLHTGTWAAVARAWHALVHSALEEFGNLAQDMHNLVIRMAISLPQSCASLVRGPTDLGAMMLTDELAAQAHHSIDSPAPGWQAHWPLLSHVLKTAAVRHPSAPGPLKLGGSFSLPKLVHARGLQPLAGDSAEAKLKMPVQAATSSSLSSLTGARLAALW